MQTLFEVCRKKVLEITGVDVSRKYLVNYQHIIDGKITFIGILSKHLGVDKFPCNEIGKFIHLNRSTVWVHLQKIIKNEKITKEITNNINTIYLLTQLELKKSIDQNTPSVKQLLTYYKEYLYDELRKTDKLLQEI